MSRKVRRLVVKIGTSLLTRDDSHLDAKRMRQFANELVRIRKAGVEVLVVTSGAIAAGVSELGWRERPTAIVQKQVAAAVGQPRLMETYRQLFRSKGVRVAQLLLTREDFESQSRAQNAQATLSALLHSKVIPIINENDSVAVEEIRVGDNDTLAARVAVLVKADLLVLLTDVEGLMDKHPDHGHGKLISRVEHIGSNVEAIAHGTSGARGGTGGMQTKIQAARKATSHGVDMVIASGKRSGVLASLIKGKPAGTFFSRQK